LKFTSIGEWIVDKENDGTLECMIQIPFVGYSEMLQNDVAKNTNDLIPNFVLRSMLVQLIFEYMGIL